MPVDLTSCVTIEDSMRRLACYDQVAGKLGADHPPGSADASVHRDLVPPPDGAPTRTVGLAGKADGEALGSQVKVPGVFGPYWELDAGEKRGTFNYAAYRPNFFLPLRAMQSVNQTPSSPTRGTASNLPAFQNAETRLQLSLRSKVLQDTGLAEADLWVAYTQQSMWQLWNHASSAPFRATDHQPEVIYVVPTSRSWTSLPAGFEWRLSQVGFVHQSNGESRPLSRSWNRLYGLIGVEKGDVSATLRLEARTDGGDGANDDNPDIVHFLGRSETCLNWSPGAATLALAWRPAPEERGSLQFDWTYPVDVDRPDGLWWYFQAFEGYGETLIDYNYRQSSMGPGLSLFSF